MILVCGIHGVGKTLFSRRLSYQKELPLFSASQLIDKAFPLNQRQSKIIDSIVYRQNILLSEINELYNYNDNYILDGHLCVVDQAEHITKVGINVLLAMRITEIFVLIADPLLICERLEKRDKVIYDEKFIEKYQDEELAYAKYLSRVLSIDLHIVHSDNLNKDSILLSIKPTYSNMIFTGEKKYEYRKRICKKHIERIIIYESYPTKAVVGEVQVVSKMSMDKKELWRVTNDYAGISEDTFMEYFKDSNIACAYQLGHVIRYPKEISLEELGVSKAPQSFIYL